jgi:signal transduction histidine kinase/ligand-binding sensor domain-containing protein
LSQSYLFNKISVENGLTQNSVTCVLQDSRGFLWLGTYGGLNRYDGNKIINFFSDVNDETTLSNNAVKVLLEDRDKNLWIGCYNGGLCKFDRKKEKFTRFRNTLDPEQLSNLDNILSMSVDENGILWIGNEGGLSSFDTKTNKYLKHYYHFVANPKNVNSREVFTTFIDKNNNLWIGIQKMFGIFNRQTENFEKHFYEDNFSATKIIADEENNLWVSSSKNGVFQFNSEKGIINHYSTYSKNGNQIPSDNIEALFSDSRGNIWFGSRGNGIFILNKKSKRISSLYHDRRTSTSISNNYIYGFYQDRSNTLWIGTNIGANFIDLNRKKFNSLTIATSDQPESSDLLVSTIARDKKGNFYLGTWGAGIFVLNKDYSIKKHIYKTQGSLNSITNNNIRHLYVDKKNRLWIATNGGGLNILDINKNRFYNFSEDDTKNYLPDNFYNYIYEDRNDNIWVGAWHGGLIKCSLSENGVITYKNYTHNNNNPTSLSHNTVTSVFQASDGTYWISTKGGGLNKIIGYDDDGEPKFKHYKNFAGNPNSISSNEIMVILEDKLKNIWIGTNTAGICIYRKDKDSFINFTTKNGLISNVVSSMVEDTNSNIWISTLKGISKFDTKKHTFQNYVSADGIISNSFTENAFYKDGDKLFFGGDKGVTFFDPDSIIDNEIKPYVAITEFQIFNQTVEIDKIINGSVLLPEAISEIKKIELSHKETIFSIGFASLHFASPQKSRFAYKLNGFDKEWRYSDSKRQFETYTNLDPGEYLFEVKASNNDGFWSEQTASLKIIINPPFWATWWAYLIYISFLLGIIFLYVRFKTNENEKEIKLLRKTDKLKTEFLAQMSHEIRSPINVILGFISLFHERVSEKFDNELDEYFESIKKASKRITRTIDLLLNMSEVQTGNYEITLRKINFEKDILDDIMSEYEMIAREKKLKLDLIIENELPELELDEYTISQILANLVDNALKYTLKGGVTIRVKGGADSSIIVSIEDTGIGISEEYLPNLFKPFTQEEQGYSRRFEGNGLGLALVKKYCDIHEIQISVESKKEVGSKFNLIIKNKTHLL